jgi:hypothetical protein
LDAVEEAVLAPPQSADSAASRLAEHDMLSFSLAMPSGAAPALVVQTEAVV